MPKLILPKEAARQVVSSGTKASGKSIQTFKRSIPSEEESIVLIRISSEWTVLETGGYRATGVMIGASGNVRSGEVFVYALAFVRQEDSRGASQRSLGDDSGR